MNTVAHNLINALSETSAHTLTIVATTIGAREASDIADSDISAFYVQKQEALTTVWLLTPERIMRVEVSNEAALAITFPLSRVSRVAELYSSDGYAVTVEVDADSTTTVDNRAVFSNYTIVAQDAIGTANLQEFSRVVRTCLR